MNSNTKRVDFVLFLHRSYVSSIPAKRHWMMTDFRPQSIFAGLLVIDDRFQEGGKAVIFVLPFAASMQKISP